MPKRAITTKLIPKTFAELRDAVMAVVVEGRRAIDRAWVESYHEIGRLIHEHLLFKQARAAYGAGVFADLAKESGISSRTLHEWVQFYRAFPIVRELAQLTWNHFRLLGQIDDAGQRVVLAKKALTSHWTSPMLEERVRALNAAIDLDAVSGNRASAKSSHPPLVPRRGTPGIYRVAKIEGALVVDFGFASYFDLPSDTDFAAGDWVTVDAAGRMGSAAGATKADLFNYRVELIRVVDDDTLWVKIYLGPRRWVKQKLRLRGLDCPEMSTSEGRAAKRFVDALVAKATTIVINTTKPDKYDRYLADVFLVLSKDVVGVVEPGPGSTTPATTQSEAVVYLNNTLLENGHAVR